LEDVSSFMSSEEFGRRGSDLYESGDIDAALKTYEDGLDIYPFTPELHTGRCFMYLYLGEFVRALVAFGCGLNLNPLDPELNKCVGIALCYLNRADEAMLHLDRALPHFRGEEQHLFDISMALFQASRYSDALPLFEELADLAPDNVEAHYYRAMTLHHVGGRTDDSRAAYEQALSLDPGRVDIAESFANALYDCGLYGEALVVFKSLDIDDVRDDLLVERMIEVFGKFRGTRRRRSALRRRLSELRSRSEIDDFIEDLEEEWKAVP